MRNILFDLYRYTGRIDNVAFIKTLLADKVFRKIFYHRAINYCKNKHGILTVILKALRKINAQRITIDMPTSVQLGRGVLFIHPYSIAINSKAVIGSNATILHGVTVGLVKNGPRAGVPKIGNNVYLGANSSVLGGINVGDNCLICSNSFVDFDVPANSVVLGNPGVIHRKNKPSKIYLNNSIEDLI